MKYGIGQQVKMKKTYPDFGYNAFFAKYDYVFTIKSYDGFYYSVEEDFILYRDDSIEGLYVEGLYVEETDPIYDRFEILDL